MKRNILFLLSLFVLTANAQDVIRLKDGKEIQAKISEINQSEIKYKNYDYQDGPTFTIDKSDVITITYANGMTEEIKAAPKLPKQQEEESGSFWKPSLWTNQKESGFSVFADLGGFVMDGGKFGIEARWRRLSANVFVTNGPSKGWWSIGDDPEDELESLSGFGFGYTFKVLLPTANKRTTIHVGVINAIRNLDYVYSFPNGGTETWSTNMVSTGFGGGLGHYKENGMFFRASGYFGLNVLDGGYKYEHYYSDGGQTVYGRDSDPWVSFYGTLELTIGYEFPIKKK